MILEILGLFACYKLSKIDENTSNKVNRELDSINYNVELNHFEKAIINYGIEKEMSADAFETFLNKIYLNTSKLEQDDLTKLNKTYGLWRKEKRW